MNMSERQGQTSERESVYLDVGLKLAAVSMHKLEATVEFPAALRVAINIQRHTVEKQLTVKWKLPTVNRHHLPLFTLFAITTSYF